MSYKLFIPSLVAAWVLGIHPLLAQDDIFGVYMSARAETPCGRGTPIRSEECLIKQTAIDLKVEFDKDPLLDPGLRCEPATLVRLFTWFPRPVEILQGDNEIVFRYENMGVIRTIHMNDQPAPPPEWTSIHGFSRGHWEENTLVVETSNLNGNLAVIPTSNQTTTVERYRWNQDRSQLLLDITVTDPLYYDAPFKLQPAAFDPMPDGYIGDYECSVQTEDLFYGDMEDFFK